MAPPKPMTTRSRQALRRREALLSISLRLFSEKGFHATSVRDIAREAGITEGLIYHYFQSKESLLKAIVTHALEKDPPQRYERGSGQVPLEKALRDVGSRLLDRLRANKEIFRLMVSESNLFEQTGDLFYPKMIYDTGMRRLGVFLKERMDRGELRCVDPILAARQFAGSLVAFFIFQEILLGKRVVPVFPETFLDVSIGIFLNGVRADSSGLPSPKRAGALRKKGRADREGRNKAKGRRRPGA